MPAWIALLRAVNVGGRGAVSMPELKKMAEELGLEQPKTLLNSGNLVFSDARRSGADLEALLEEQTAKRLQVQTDYIIRSIEELDAAIAANPLPAQAAERPSALLVLFLKTPADSANVAALQSAIAGPELVEAGKQELYVFYGNGMGRSKLTNTLIERKLKVAGTGRNWNTVLKLSALAREL